MGKSARIFGAALALGAAQLAGAATVNVSVRDFRFVPNDITINAGDTVHWANQGGVHNVVADDGSFVSSNGQSGSWTFDRTFSQAGTVLYHCSVHSGPGQNISTSMNGRITVVGATAPAFSINQGISGGWFNPSTAGQGFLIDVRPSDKFMFVAWFTYETAEATGDSAKLGSSEQRWLVAQGNYVGAGAQLPLFNVSGGRFNDPRAVSATQIGTLNVNFTTCNAGTFAYTLPGNVSGQIGVQRLLPGSDALCVSLQGTAAAAEQAAQ
jgi:plastocyanin